MSSQSNKLILKANLPRTRDLSFVGRFHHNFGFEESLFEYLLEQKDMWGDKLFYMNETQFKKWVEQEKHKIRPVPLLSDNCGFPEMETEPLSQAVFDADFGPIDPISLRICKGGQSAQQTLEKGQLVSLKDTIDRNGIAMNVGGYVTAMKWLHYSLSSYLAVFVINNPSGLASLVTDPSLSVFNEPLKAQSIRSALQLWKYDVHTSSPTLCQVFDTTAFGATSNLVWLPVSLDKPALGILSAVFTDGCVHFFKLNEAQAPSYANVLKPSWTVKMTDERRSTNPPLPITAFDFLTHDKVLVGTIDGAVAEFLLPFHKNQTEDISLPSFVNYVADYMITSICIAEVDESHVVLINTATTQSFAMHYEQLRVSRVETNFTISSLKPLYHRGYRIFIYPDSAESIGYTFLRHPHQKHSLLLKTELITAFHTSEFLNHPFAVVGNTCGDVFVMNIGRKIFGVPKAHNKLVVPLKIWSLQKSADGYTLLGDYIPTAPDRTDIMYTFTPPEVVISAAAWNENLAGCSSYAFGTYTGLLVIERLDPGLL